MQPRISDAIIDAEGLMRAHGITLQRIEMTREQLDRLADEVGARFYAPSREGKTATFNGVDIVVHE